LLNLSKANSYRVPLCGVRFCYGKGLTSHVQVLAMVRARGAKQMPGRAPLIDIESLPFEFRLTGHNGASARRSFDKSHMFHIMWFGSRRVGSKGRGGDRDAALWVESPRFDDEIAVQR
jgi:hypothetical protein